MNECREDARRLYQRRSRSARCEGQKGQLFLKATVPVMGHMSERERFCVSWGRVLGEVLSAVATTASAAMAVGSVSLTILIGLAVC